MKQNKSYYLKLIIVNTLTLIRLVGAFILPFIYINYGPVTVSIWVLVIFGTDSIDGNLARCWHVQTFFGSLMDGICDKLFGIVSLGILSSIRNIMFIPLLLEIAIIIVNLIAYKSNKNVQSSKLGKRKTIILALTIVLSFILIASPIYIEALPDILKHLIETYSHLLIYVLSGIIIGIEVIVLTDYSIKALRKEKTKKINKNKKPNLENLKYYLFNSDFYINNKDKPLREILYK